MNDPRNATMRFIMNKLGLARSAAGLVDDIRLLDRLPYKMAHPKPDIGVQELHPTTMTEAEIADYEELYTQEWIASKHPIALLCGQKNADWHKKTFPNRTEIALSDVEIFTPKIKISAYIEWNDLNTIRRITFVSYHPEGLWRCQRIKILETIDYVWNLAADLSGRRIKNPKYFERNAADWIASETDCHDTSFNPSAFGEKTGLDIISIILKILFNEKLWNRRFAKDQLPPMVIAGIEKEFHNVDEIYAPDAKVSPTRALHGVYSARGRARGWATQEAAGHPSLVRGRATLAAAGHPGLVRGRATLAAAGHPSLVRGRATQAAAGHPHLVRGRATQAANGSPGIAKAQSVSAELAMPAGFRMENRHRKLTAQKIDDPKHYAGLKKRRQYRRWEQLSEVELLKYPRYQDMVDSSDIDEFNKQEHVVAYLGRKAASVEVTKANIKAARQRSRKSGK